MLQEMPVLYYSVKEKLEISAKFPLKKIKKTNKQIKNTTSRWYFFLPLTAGIISIDL